MGQVGGEKSKEGAISPRGSEREVEIERGQRIRVSRGGEPGQRKVGRRCWSNGRRAGKKRAGSAAGGHDVRETAATAGGENTPRWRPVVLKKNVGHSGGRRQRTATPGQEHSHANRQAARLPAQGVTSSEGAPPPLRHPPSRPRWRWCWGGAGAGTPAFAVPAGLREGRLTARPENVQIGQSRTPLREAAGGGLVCGTLISIHLHLADELAMALNNNLCSCYKIHIEYLNQSGVKLQI